MSDRKCLRKNKLERELRERARARGIYIGNRLSPLMSSFVNDTAYDEALNLLTVDQVLDFVEERNFLDEHVKDDYDEIKRGLQVNPEKPLELRIAKKYAMMAFKLAGGDVSTAPLGLRRLLLR